jgi:integrase
MTTIQERTQHIALWTAEFGPRARHTIGTAEIDAVLSRWLKAGLASSTVRHRRTALLHLWNRLDGAKAPNPVRRSIKPAEPEPEARGVSYDRIRAVLAALPDIGQGLKGRARERGSKTAARLAVMAYTGLPQSLIKRLTPADIDWQAGTLYASATHKGKGTRRKVLPLTIQTSAALRRFAALECWGGFSNSSLWKISDARVKRWDSRTRASAGTTSATASARRCTRWLATTKRRGVADAQQPEDHRPLHHGRCV